MGVNVTLAATGEEGINIFNKSCFDVILLDLNLPEMDGYHIANLVRNNNCKPKRTIPIIALTGTINESVLIKKHIKPLMLSKNHSSQKL
ncbi:MAG: CheY-like chemotaxis protein [Sphingobacteriales bacterium]|jgi:CheY-like chemotaxis protein